jgi:DNA repair exonuclease SbcCD nuclease subunit
MKFAHLGDCHLGGWRQPELKALNFQSFKFAVDKCIKERVDFILIAGDLFDSAYPPIDTLKDTFGEFRKLKEAEIPVFLVAGSHDYSASGKSFLDVLEKAGFCKNVAVFEERDDKIMLQPVLYKNVSIYGYPGKKSSLEVADVSRIKLQDSPGFFKILMQHTAIKDAVPSLPIQSVDHEKLPKVDYLALAHLHITYSKEGRVYSGPVFPNNISELEELQGGAFYIFNDGKISRQEIKIKSVLSLNIEIEDALSATDTIIKELDKKNVRDKIIILKVFGILEKGKTSDIQFSKIESYLKQRNCYVFLKSTSKLHMPEPEIKMDLSEAINIEEQIIKNFEEKHPSKFNYLISNLIRSLQIEKLEEEKVATFKDRLMTETKKILGI